MNKAFLIIGMILVCGVIASYIDLPLPAGIEKITRVKGRINYCDIENYTGGKSRPSLLFVGITLDKNVAPYLRWNPPKTDLEGIQRMCIDHRLINVTYRAKRTLLRPKVSYWIEQLEIINT